MSMQAQELAREAWLQLRRATVDKRHAFRFVALATRAKDTLENRMVVMRSFSASGEVSIYTDERTHKVSAIQEHGEVALLWWDPKHKLQVRFQAQARLLPSDEAIAYAPQQGQDLKDYTTQKAPGMAIQQPEAVTWSDELHFTVISCMPFCADLLQLGKPHKRVKGERRGDKWNWQWVVP